MKSKRCLIIVIGAIVIAIIILFIIVSSESTPPKNKEVNELEHVTPEEVGRSSTKLEEAGKYAEQIGLCQGTVL